MALQMLVESGGLSLEIWSSGECRGCRFSELSSARSSTPATLIVSLQESQHGGVGVHMPVFAPHWARNHSRPKLPVPNNIMLLPLPPGSGTGGHAQRDSVLHPKAAFSRSTLCAHMTCLNALKLSWLLRSQWSFFVRARIDTAIRSGSLQKISASTPSYNRTRTLRKAGARSRLSGDRYLKSRESETCGILLVNCKFDCICH